MTTAPSMEDTPVRARIPADLDAPDRFVAGLTARQLALLIAVAVPVYGLWMGLGGRVPVTVLAVITAPLAALTLVVAVGRRDGLSLDRWLLAATAHLRRPHRLTPSAEVDVPSWAPPDPGPPPRLGVLRLPGEAIGQDGVISTGQGSATALVAASTVTSGLHTPGEQAVLVSGYARWLNSLSGPVQVLVSARRVDLEARALELAEGAHLLPHPALARAAIEHAEHLLDLSEDSDRLTRTLTIACTATSPAGARPQAGRGGSGPARGVSRAGAEAEALRRAERTAAALSVISSPCRVLNGGEVTAVLVAATDPYGPSEASWPRTPPGTTITVADPYPGTWAREDSPRDSRPAWDDRAQGEDGAWDEDTRWGQDGLEDPGEDGWDR